MKIILFIIAIAIIFIVLPIWLSSTKKKVKKATKRTSTNSILLDEKSYIKKQFLTNNERVFFRGLTNLIGDDNYIMAQVRLADIIKPDNKFSSKSKEYLSLFRQISQWHCDFVIINKKNLNIEYVIELDDSSHKYEKRIKRDNIFNEALKQAEIKLFRIYNLDEFKLKINEFSVDKEKQN